MSSDTLKIARKLNSSGVEWEQAQTHAEVITDTVEDALGKVATKEFVENRINRLRGEQRADFSELRADFSEQKAENKASQLNQLRWIVGTIIAVGGLIIASNLIS
ncbi:MAG: hypothetical protein OXF08_01140 [Bacteroidetes bacterium]|nr:hypothetical protein [Bacteroidota bacterium]